MFSETGNTRTAAPGERATTADTSQAKSMNCSMTTGGPANLFTAAGMSASVMTLS